MYRGFRIWKISAERFPGNKQRNRPESEWIYAENTHEGIIDKELFRQVQEKSGNLRKNIKKRHQLNNGAIRSQNFYTGKIRCGGCGNRMILSREKSGTFYYICGANANHKSGGNQCKGHRVKKEYVDEDVLRLIQSHMKNVLDTEKNDPGNELRFQKPDAIFAFGQGSREISAGTEPDQ